MPTLLRCTLFLLLVIHYISRNRKLITWLISERSNYFYSQPRGVTLSRACVVKALDAFSGKSESSVKSWWSSTGMDSIGVCVLEVTEGNKNYTRHLWERYMCKLVLSLSAKGFFVTDIWARRTETKEKAKRWSQRTLTEITSQRQRIVLTACCRPKTLRTTRPELGLPVRGGSSTTRTAKEIIVLKGEKNVCVRPHFTEPESGGGSQQGRAVHCIVHPSVHQPVI